MSRQIVIKTTPSIKQTLEDWHRSLSQQKGVRVLKHESDDIFAQMARHQLMNQHIQSDVIPPQGRRRKQIRFTL